MIKIQIEDSQGSGRAAKVSGIGQLIVAPYDFSSPSVQKLEVAGTAYNFVSPITGFIIIVTGLILYANKNVGVNDATVDIYEASAIDSTVIDKSIFQTEMLKQTPLALTGLNLKVSEGKWLNGKTDDDDVFVTVLYYYAPVG